MLHQKLTLLSRITDAKRPLQNKESARQIDCCGERMAVVPKGTTIIEGTATPQSIYKGAGNLLGGGNQVYIPEVNPTWFGR